MKIVTINGSPRNSGNTAYTLDVASTVFKNEGIETERIDIGVRAIRGCAGCRLCRQRLDRRCIANDDIVNSYLETLFTADGLLVSSPVYYAGINGALKSFLDRAFFVASANGALFRHKVGAGMVAVRRAGATTALEQINKYLAISEMFVPTSSYWGMAYGMAPGESAQDVEGVQTAQVLAANMAWLLKALDAARKIIPPPAAQAKIMMNFIR
ncbi:MAG: flavodoxin family protein [Planctomycetota bacterium]|jgi:multimeric flavodoxin WrbA|nr:flavodoxin family protein [Planctomycetota bacterium]